MLTYDQAVSRGQEYSGNGFILDRPVWKKKRYYINYVIAFLKDYLYKLVFFLWHIEEKKYNYHLSICAIFKNEAPFLREWIEYHLLIGVDHFYLYNNNSEDDYYNVLREYLDNGIVTLVNWPDIPGQLTSYKHWYNNYRRETKWVTFLDLDEYICLKYHNSIATWLNKWNSYPVIMVYWKMFGTSGKEEHDYNKLTIEQYVNSWEKLTDIGKIFYNTAYDIDLFHVGMMHTINVRFKQLIIPPINNFGYFVINGFHRSNNKEHDIQINHYWSKSYKAYQEKHKRGDASFGISPRDYDYFLWHETRNVAVDMTIFRHLIPLKKRMGII